MRTTQERKYFDSGDYALSKAGKAPQQSVGTAIPNPETIPHASTVGSSPGVTAAAGSPGAVGSPISGNGNGMNASLAGSPMGIGIGQSINGNGSSNPINVPGGGLGALSSRQPAVSSFPTATGAAGSPQGKEASSLGREEVKADDGMDEEA